MNDSIYLDTKTVMKTLANMHDPAKWAFFEELRIGTGFGKDSEQRLDAWAVHYYPSKRNVARCYEVKTSRSDFLSEMKKPKKRRAGLRLSNEFFFVAPAKMLKIEEIPPECGLMEVYEDGKIATRIKAPYRDTVPPTFLFMASVCRRIDKERFEQYRKDVRHDEGLMTYTFSALKTMEKHIDKWKYFNEGNKEVPDQIASALEEVYFDIKNDLKEKLRMLTVKK